MSKKIVNDVLFGLLLLVIVTPFVFSKGALELFMSQTVEHPYIMAFVKFFILATLGEMLGLRIKSGVYNYKGFGVAPRSIVWGLFGVWIAIAMKVFAVGTPIVVEGMGVEGLSAAMKGGFSWIKLLGAFSISVMMNSAFAPSFMSMHKVTDTHIINNEGKLKALVTPIKMGEILSSLNWRVQWGFVFKKTIPLFWVPAHTITFMLPSELQVLFAAILSVFLGLFLSIAARLSAEKERK